MSSGTFARGEVARATARTRGGCRATGNLGGGTVGRRRGEHVLLQLGLTRNTTNIMVIWSFGHHHRIRSRNDTQGQSVAREERHTSERTFRCGPSDGGGHHPVVSRCESSTADNLKHRPKGDDGFVVACRESGPGRHPGKGCARYARQGGLSGVDARGVGVIESNAPHTTSRLATGRANGGPAARGRAAPRVCDTSSGCGRDT